MAALRRCYQALRSAEARTGLSEVLHAHSWRWVQPQGCAPARWLYSIPLDQRREHDSAATLRQPLPGLASGLFPPSTGARAVVFPQHAHQLARARHFSASAAAASAPPAVQTPAHGLTDQQIIRQLFGYVWPADNPEFKRRVAGALALLLGSKLLNIQVPFLFKYTVDALAAPGVPDAQTLAMVGWASPVVLLAAYGCARAGASLMSELRNAVFAKVAQGTIRKVGNQVRCGGRKQSLCGTGPHVTVLMLRARCTTFGRPEQLCMRIHCTSSANAAL